MTTPFLEILDFDFVFQQTRKHYDHEEEHHVVSTVPDLTAKIVNAKASRRRLVRTANFIQNDFSF